MDCPRSTSKSCISVDGSPRPRTRHDAPSRIWFGGACGIQEIQEAELYSIFKEHERSFGSAFVFRTKTHWCDDVP